MKSVMVGLLRWILGQTARRLINPRLAFGFSLTEAPFAALLRLSIFVSLFADVNP
jgi:hypothetical protein